MEGGNDAATAAAALSRYLDARPRERWPRALYASNELLLRGMLTVLRERGLRVPDDVAVAAFDDFAWADLLDPPVTVVDQQTARLGRECGLVVLDALDGAGRRPSAKRLLLPPALRVRLSCGGPVSRTPSRAPP